MGCQKIRPKKKIYNAQPLIFNEGSTFNKPQWNIEYLSIERRLLSL
jgi:hypothetical protein